MEYGFVSSPSQSPNRSHFAKNQYFDSPSESSGPNSPHGIDQMVYGSMPMQFGMFHYSNNPPSYLIPQSEMIPVEYTGSSTLDEKDRRRRRTTSASSSSSRDKDAIPNMHLRRRAQNRASQRAFRERKEKHVKGLEHQLEDLHEKHRDLLLSYTRQAEEVTKLHARIQELNVQIETLRSCTDQSFSELLTPDKFDKFDAFSGHDVVYEGLAYPNVDRSGVEISQSTILLDTLEESL